MKKDKANKTIQTLIYKTKIILLLTISINITLKSQDISTIAEIYDFDVGDVFHYYSDYYHMTVQKTIYEITDKYYSPNNDTLYYVRNYQEASGDFPDTIWTYTFGTQTIYYTELDSLILSGEFVSVGLFNGRTYNLYNPCECEWLGYAEGVGLVEDLLFICGYGEFVHNIELRYYKKGEEEWGTPLNLLTRIKKNNKQTNIEIYPNPALNSIYIDLTNCKKVIETVSVFTKAGNLIKTIQIENHGLNIIDIANLESGIYLLEFYSVDTRYIRKIIKQ